MLGDQVAVHRQSNEPRDRDTGMRRHRPHIAQVERRQRRQRPSKRGTTALVVGGSARHSPAILSTTCSPSTPPRIRRSGRYDRHMRHATNTALLLIASSLIAGCAAQSITVNSTAHPAPSWQLAIATIVSVAGILASAWWVAMDNQPVTCCPLHKFVREIA
jgi:hypothetical protein